VEIALYNWSAFVDVRAKRTMGSGKVNEGQVTAMEIAIFLMLAGLMGAAGVALLAAGAHASPGAGLDSAGQILLFHAAAIIGGVAALAQGLLARPAATIALAGFVLGALLFSGDIALRAFAGQRLFPLAAPTGGTILILAWLAVAATAAFTALRPN
jgi:uncharacterized membrane protein YgdD (TMEM256/DUF423 family)